MKRWHKLFAVLAVCLLSFGYIGYLGRQHSEKVVYADGTFTPMDLGTTFTPVGISDSGIVAGNINGGSVTYAGIWQSGSFTPLSAPSGSTSNRASGISSTGEVVGHARYSTQYGIQDHAVKWNSNGSATDLGGPPSSSSCNTNTGSTQPYAVNDLGDIAGVCSDSVYYAGYWPGGAPNSFTQLPNINNLYSGSGGASITAGINHSDHIVGYSVITDSSLPYGTAAHATFWENGTATDLNPSGADESWVNAINDNDLAVGGFINYAYGFHAYVWDLANNSTYDLTAITGYPGMAIAVNSSGVVVGDINFSNPNSHAFMWKVGDSSLIDLNSLLPTNSGWILTDVSGINSSGQIVGTGILNSQSHAFLLNTSNNTSSYQLSLAPASQTATIGGGQGLVTATLLVGATSTPASNMKLSFRVEAGPNAGLSGTCFPSSCTTDTNGQADWGYFGKAVGVDTVQIWVDTNGNGVPDTGEPQTTATVIWIRSAQAYVALGDSYSSGEGAPNPKFLPGTDNHTIPNLCHRSTAAYPWLTHKATSNTYPTFVFRACSGARIKDFSSANQEGNKGEPAQLSWLNSYTGLVTLSVGGNDVGFADVMGYCAKRLLTMPSCKSVYNAKVNALVKQIGSTQITSSSTPTTLLSLYEAIGTAAPNAKVLVVGYPRLFPATNLPLLCPTGIFLPVVGATYFTRSDMQWLNQEGQNLDNAIKTAVENVNKAEHSNRFVYVSTYDAFNGHELCTSHPYVNRTIIDTSYDPFKLKQWSFHPNISGQAALAAIVESYA